MKRAYAILTVKAVQDGEQRVIEGTATTPTPDRVGDVVEPMGAKFQLPVPFLWQHQHDKPVGLVEWAKATKDGIKFRARLAVVEEAGALRDRIEEAWQTVKAGLVRGVSIGFQPTEYSFLADGDGMRFSAWDWLELSLVTIPANAEATISTIKSIDAELLAASGREQKGEDVTPAASGEKPKPIVKGKRSMAKKQTLAEQIAAFKDTRAEKSARMSEIMEEAEGSTLDAEQTEEFDGLEAEIEQIDAHLKRLRTLQKSQAETAKPVEDDERGGDPRDARLAPIAAKAKAPKPEPGVRLARYARCLALATKQHRDVTSIAEEQYGSRDPEVVGMIKAAVIASNTTTDAALIGNEGGWADFVEYLRPRTIIGRFGTNGFPSVTRIPFRVPLITEASESAAYWVGEGKAKPLTKATWSRTELAPLKVATIAVATMEQLRDSSPSAETLIRNSIAEAIVKRQDVSFIDPTNSGSPGVSPASILNGVAAVDATGQYDADGVREGVYSAMAAFASADNPLTSGVWIMGAARALRLSLMLNPLGQAEFPGITMQGGTFFGLPVMVSNYVAADVVALVNAADIYVGDDGGISVDMSTEASLEMMDNPTQDSVAAAPVAADLVSMFQTNSVAFRAERTINWMRRRATAVKWLDTVTWGEEAPGT